jgi:hypothetical protein
MRSGLLHAQCVAFALDVHAVCFTLSVVVTRLACQACLCCWSPHTQHLTCSRAPVWRRRSASSSRMHACLTGLFGRVAWPAVTAHMAAAGLDCSTTRVPHGGEAVTAGWSLVHATWLSRVAHGARHRLHTCSGRDCWRRWPHGGCRCVPQRCACRLTCCSTLRALCHGRWLQRCCPVIRGRLAQQQRRTLQLTMEGRDARCVRPPVLLSARWRLCCVVLHDVLC